jgi:hypothetical protein
VGHMKNQIRSNHILESAQKTKGYPNEYSYSSRTMLVVTSLFASSLAYDVPPSNRESAKRFCARISDSRIMFVDPRPSDLDSMPSFNLVDGQSIR